LPGKTSLIILAPGVPGHIILSPQVVPALPISPVIESTATIEKVCWAFKMKGNNKRSNIDIFMGLSIGLIFKSFKVDNTILTQ
jgi:hypothetical protein